MKLNRHGNAVPAPEGVEQERLDHRVAIFKDGHRLMASHGYALKRSLTEGWSTSQDTESSGRETVSSRDAGAPAAGTASRSEVGTKAGENPGSDEGGGSLAQGARPGP